MLITLCGGYSKTCTLLAGMCFTCRDFKIPNNRHFRLKLWPKPVTYIKIVCRTDNSTTRKKIERYSNIRFIPNNESIFCERRTELSKTKSDAKFFWEQCKFKKKKLVHPKPWDGIWHSTYNNRIFKISFL